MNALAEFLASPRRVALAILLAAVATIGGALVFEHGFGLRPCPLCLMQRNPYYVAMPVAFGLAVLPPRPALERASGVGLLLLAGVFLVSAGLGAYHAGVEWGWWLGPSDCAGTGGANPAAVGDFLQSLQGTRVVSCTEAAWRFLGLSLAGWNVLISLAIAAVAALGAKAALTRG
ncbi:Disulfide bond formation protein DsbB [Chelatococcus sambhunathii]|uniref:Disulfide bond formation protein B n=2 Tax=Chelatococcus TaxID=28209 RepID=A0AAC9JPS1_9HYPH|nr:MULTISPECIES: disulfide bond formation protein B [Chelatococcus]APF36640.1 disulfide bond formation protein B [Chelatococcus daeguensis]CUA90754.1 Disulfide bond formation protein DsbB [Chelatococcus sambhunathii]